jgi:hypothetical protein
MKEFIAGLSTGYLLTSIFSIPALPTYFWFFATGLTIVCSMFALAWWKVNDDLVDGDF